MIDTKQFYKKNTELDNYQMKPYYLNGLGLIYPILLNDYNDFAQLFSKYMLVDIKGLNRLKKQQWEKDLLNKKIEIGTRFVKLKEDNLYDYLVNSIFDFDKKLKFIKSQKENAENIIKDIPKDNIEKYIDLDTYNQLQMIVSMSMSGNIVEEELCKMFTLICRNKVKFNYDIKIFYILNNNNIIGEINKDNFDNFRDIVMKQNLLFSPRIADNLDSQRSIDREREILSRNGIEASLESMLAFVSDGNYIDISNITYYRFKADFEMKQRKMNIYISSIYNANGCRTKDDKPIPIPNVADSFEMKINPYTRDAKIVDQKEINKYLIKSN